ncbi:hypothetical protein LTR10_016508 [Elasticomyces elasticus]|uniref:Haloacid dehalogenase, type II n=1 Tax=Exophiala sideris TaxID=1016849 RepID=A0ABR0IX56_9EURO|nr:hypothetical protein LTR10_016508 [Elasticomyces elasticus]KAK5022014.1 hypothetical protein LTS07_010429 [Exophiala sideris]KAK5026317.1 hypothetical protein LTR13_010099 [Exophiala sideris]KAK5051107.1 hypothetical protein LTR69_010484 [Exophiala sideris]KAK5177249.1 hypothetical protein LTR44_010210 [Eurotiomycetes sp. CCFEE 6388]
MDSELPMPTPTVTVKALTSFKSLSFDIYETLIQWEKSIVEHLQPLVTYHTASTDRHVRDDLAELFAKHERNLQAESPSMKYNEILAKAYLCVASDIGAPNHDAAIEHQAQAFGDSVGDWPAFPDTVDAMNRLSKYYKLIALSNVDRDSFSRTNAGSLKDLNFWRVFTAQDIGSYKPDLRNFEYLFKHLDEDDKEEGGSGITKDENLHVAQSLFHDHKPAKKLGISSVWINRKGAGTGKIDFKDAHDKGEAGYGWRFHTLGEFADEVDRQWKGEN